MSQIFVTNYCDLASGRWIDSESEGILQKIFSSFFSYRQFYIKTFALQDMHSFSKIISLNFWKTVVTWQGQTQHIMPQGQLQCTMPPGRINNAVPEPPWSNILPIQAIPVRHCMRALAVNTLGAWVAGIRSYYLFHRTTGHTTGTWNNTWYREQSCSPSGGGIWPQWHQALWVH